MHLISYAPLFLPLTFACALPPSPPKNQLGGLEAYQAFSMLGEGKRAFNCAHWVVEKLYSNGLAPAWASKLVERRQRRRGKEKHAIDASDKEVAHGSETEESDQEEKAENGEERDEKDRDGPAKESRLDSTGKTMKKLRLLDVGALGENYRAHNGWMDVMAIDLHTCHPAVTEVRMGLCVRERGVCVGERERERDRETEREITKRGEHYRAGVYGYVM